MGDMLYLAKTDYTDVDAKVDLINGGLRLRRGSWEPRGGEVGGPPVVETMDLVSEETNAAAIAELARLEELLEYARTYPLNPVQDEGTWMEWGIDAEPRVSAEEGYPAKRAFVYGGKLEIGGAKGLPGAFLNDRAVGRLAIERHPLWENLEPVSDGFYNVYWGAVEDLTGLTEMGTAPARIQQTDCAPATSDEIQEYWVGIRSVDMGWADFDPLWELENGTNGTDTSDAVDATASGGDKITCDFATETGLDLRSSINIYQAVPTATYETHFHGRYVVLARVKVGSSTECGLVLSYGGGYAGGRARCEEVYIDNTSWRLIELGEVTNPAAGFRDDFRLYTTAFTLAIEAERLSGSGDLDLDCLYLIPAGHFAHGYYLDDDLSGLHFAIFTEPSDRQTASMMESTTGYPLAGSYMLRNWHMPTDPGFMVAAGQRISGHDLADIVYVDFVWYPRWKMFRSV